MCIYTNASVQFSSSCSVVSNCLWPHGLQHARFLCPSPTPKAFSNSCPSSQWCHPGISSSVIPFSCLQSFPASGSFPVSQFFAPGGQNIGASVSASVLPMNINWFPLGLTGLISLLQYRLCRLNDDTWWGQLLTHCIYTKSHPVIFNFLRKAIVSNA